MFRHKEVDRQPSKKQTKNGGKGSVAPKIEHIFEEETLKRERCARRDAWEMTKLSTSSRQRTKPHSTRRQKFGHFQRHLRQNPEERQFVVDFWSINADAELERSELC